MRYAVYKGSPTAHCCFDAAVVDLAQPRYGADKTQLVDDNTQQLGYVVLCECMDIEDAKHICATLNAQKDIRNIETESAWQFVPCAVPGIEEALDGFSS